jgi:hypothetical protein
LIHFKRKTFATGFLTAAVLGLAWWLFASYHGVGGHIEDSPSGRYSLMIMAPMKPTLGGTYVITLRNKATGRTLRSATVKLSSEEETKALRGLPVSMNWDSSESYVDMDIAGDFLIRMSVPASEP